MHSVFIFCLFIARNIINFCYTFYRIYQSHVPLQTSMKQHPFYLLLYIYKKKVLEKRDFSTSIFGWI